MAYPPTVPPATRVNNTVQVDNHPSDHNALSLAITDVINELGANPSGGSATVQALLEATLARVAVLESHTPRFVQGTFAAGNLQPEIPYLITTSFNTTDPVARNNYFTFFVPWGPAAGAGRLLLSARFNGAEVNAVNQSYGVGEYHVVTLTGSYASGAGGSLACELWGTVFGTFANINIAGGLATLMAF